MTDVLFSLRTLTPSQMQQTLFKFTRSVDDEATKRTIALVAEIVEVDNECMQKEQRSEQSKHCRSVVREEKTSFVF